jgi:hypothetical protein
MLVLARTPGRAIYFGRNASVRLDRVHDLDGQAFAWLTFKVPFNMAVSRGDLPKHEHESEQDRRQQLPDLGDKPKRTERHMLRVDEWVWVGSGRIMLSKIQTDRGGQAWIGFDLPNTEAVTRDDYSLDWHLEQQAKRENRRPPNGAHAGSR